MCCNEEKEGENCLCVCVRGLLCARGQLISEDDAGGQSFDSYSERMRKE